MTVKEADENDQDHHRTFLIWLRLVGFGDCDGAGESGQFHQLIDAVLIFVEQLKVCEKNPQNNVNFPSSKLGNGIVPYISTIVTTLMLTKSPTNVLGFLLAQISRRIHG